MGKGSKNMHLGMKLDMRLDLKQEQIQGYIAKFRMMNLSEGTHLALINHEENDKGRTKKYSSLGRLASSNPSKEEVQKLIREYYSGKKISIPLPYDVFDEQGALFDSGYIKDKFGKGLISE